MENPVSIIFGLRSKFQDMRHGCDVSDFLLEVPGLKISASSDHNLSSDKMNQLPLASNPLKKGICWSYALQDVVREGLLWV